MTTVTIEGAEVRLTVEQLLEAVKQLSAEERARIKRVLDDAWREEMHQLMSEVSARFEADPMTDEELEVEIEAGRQEAYEQRRSRP
jgi:hypothetical protein